MADYSINAVARKVSYTGSAGVGPYAFSFEVLSEDDVAVYFNETLLTKTTDYTVTVNANGTGSVTLIVNVGGNIPATPDADDLVVIVGARDIERTTDFVTAGDLRASALNEQLDALTIMVQQVAEELERSVKAPVYDPTGINMILPKKADRVNAFVAFDANGDISAAVPSDDVTTLAEVATDISTLADIEDGTDATDAIQTVAGISGNVTTVAGISGNVTTVAGNTSNINTVAGDLSGDDDIGTVATNIADVSSVAAIDTQVSAVAADATDIGTVATDLTGSDTIGTVAGIAANVTTVAGISSDVSTVAADGADIGTVATNIADVNTVAGISGNVTTVAGISANVTTVAGDQADIGTVATNIADVNTVAGIDSDVTTVAGISANVTSVADDAADIGTVATNIANVNTTATNIANVNTVATNISDVQAAATNIADIEAVADEVAKVITVANDLNEATSEIDTVAASIANVDAVGTNIASVNNVSANIDSVNNFGDTYFVSASEPSSPTEGDLWFDTTNQIMKVYTTSGFANAGSSVNGTSERQNYVVGTASGTYTGSTTVFPATYDAGYVDVYLNGVKLVAGTDFTATNGTSITLASAATSGDAVNIIGYGTFELSNFSINDANDVNTSGIADGQALVYNSGTGEFEAGAAGLTWQVITSSQTSVAQNGYFIDTSGGAVTLTLPASPSVGDLVRVIDLDNAATNNITVARNGEVIQGVADDLLVATDNAAFGLIYSNATHGWRIIEV